MVTNVRSGEYAVDAEDWQRLYAQRLLAEETRCRNRQDHFTPAIGGLAPLHPLHWPVERTPFAAAGRPLPSRRQPSMVLRKRRSPSVEHGMRAAPFSGYGWVTSCGMP